MAIIESLLDRDFVGVRINGISSDYFIASRGVRYVDPIPSY